MGCLFHAYLRTGERKIHMPAQKSWSGDREGKQDLGDRLQSAAFWFSTLRFYRLCERRSIHTFWQKSRSLLWSTRRTECAHAGSQIRHIHQRRDDLCNHEALFCMRKVDHQCGHNTCCLPTRLSRPAHRLLFQRVWNLSPKNEWR